MHTKNERQLSFACCRHKTLQEFNVAHATYATVISAIGVTLLSPSLLAKIGTSLSELSALNTSATGTGDAQTDEAVLLEKTEVIGVPGIGELTRLLGTVAHVLSIRTKECRMWARGFTKLRAVLATSVLSTLEFRQEEAVCDFLVDVLLADFDFLQKLSAVFAFCALGARFHGHELERVGCNVAALVTLPLPKRDGGSVLHVAASEGNLRVLKLLLKIVVLGIGGGMVEVSEGASEEKNLAGYLNCERARDRRGRTILCAAAVAGRADCCSHLLALGASPSIREDLQPRLEIMVSTHSKAVSVDDGMNEVSMGSECSARFGETGLVPEDAFIVGLPTAGVTHGQWRCEMIIENGKHGRPPETTLERSDISTADGQNEDCWLCFDQGEPYDYMYATDKGATLTKFMECLENNVLREQGFEERLRLRDFSVGWTNEVKRGSSPVHLVGRSGPSVGVGADSRVRKGEVLWSGEGNSELRETWERARTKAVNEFCEEEKLSAIPIGMEDWGLFGRKWKLPAEALFGSSVGPIQLYGKKVESNLPVTHPYYQYNRDTKEYDNKLTSAKLECDLTTVPTFELQSSVPIQLPQGRASHPDFKCGDVIGLAIDLTVQRVRTFSRLNNSEWTLVDAGDLHQEAGEPVFLAMSGIGCGGKVRFNFGDKAWAFDSAGDELEAMASFGGDGAHDHSFAPLKDAASGDTPAMLAAAAGHFDVVKLLIEASDVQALHDTDRAAQQSFCHHAAKHGKMEFMHWLLENDEHKIPKSCAKKRRQWQLENNEGGKLAQETQETREQAAQETPKICAKKRRQWQLENDEDGKLVGETREAAEQEIPKSRAKQIASLANTADRYTLTPAVYALKNGHQTTASQFVQLLKEHGLEVPKIGQKQISSADFSNGHPVILDLNGDQSVSYAKSSSLLKDVAPPIMLCAGLPITQVGLSGCGLTESDAPALAHVLLTSSTLSTLQLSENPFLFTQKAALDRVLTACCKSKRSALLYTLI
jgi:ankyrin repeat protein